MWEKGLFASLLKVEVFYIFLGVVVAASKM